GMKALLNSWKCKVYACANLTDAEAIPFKPDIMLADYQLDNDDTGLDAMPLVQKKYGDNSIPGIIISADPRDSVANDARDMGFYFLRKPIRPAALRALIRRLVG
ncbi:MAG: response regulator, partial [Oceanobacter sp.]